MSVVTSFDKSKRKLVPWIETCNSHYYESVSHQSERRTENHWHSRPETYPLRHQEDATWV